MSPRHYSLGADNRYNTSAVLTPVVPPGRCSFDSPRVRMRVALSSPSSQRAGEQSARVQFATRVVRPPAGSSPEAGRPPCNMQPKGGQHYTVVCIPPALDAASDEESTRRHALRRRGLTGEPQREALQWLHMQLHAAMRDSVSVALDSMQEWGQGSGLMRLWLRTAPSRLARSTVGVIYNREICPLLRT
jgi:hypothetical protein